MRLLILFALLPALASFARAQTERTLAFRGGPKLSVLVPAGYSYETAVNRDGSVRVTMENPVWNIAIAAVVGVESNRMSSEPEWQRNRLISFVAGALPSAKETDYEFQPLRPVTGTGIVCSLSALDDAPGTVPEPGHYLRFTGGLKAQAQTVVIFRILSNETKSPEFREAYDLFVSSFVEL